MKAKVLRLLSGIIATFLLSMICVPAVASPGSQYDQKTNFFHWIAGEGSILHDFAGYVIGMVCPNSEDGYHHATSYQKDKGDGTYRCICTYCGHEFTAYESDLKQSYDNQVAELPATGIASDGALLIQVSPSDYGFALGSTYPGVWISNTMNVGYLVSSFSYVISADTSSVRLSLKSGGKVFHLLLRFRAI